MEKSVLVKIVSNQELRVDKVDEPEKLLPMFCIISGHRGDPLSTGEGSVYSHNISLSNVPSVLKITKSSTESSL